MKNKIQKKIKNIKINKKNVTIVIGGDGFMLKTLKNNKNKSKFFMELTQEIMVSYE